MNDEIKEILEDLRNKNMSVDDLTHNDKTKLLDYITNLQKENERLKVALKGTTHCYDEEEHKKLKEENERLKEKENKLQEKFKDWKKEIEKERKHYLCDRTDCFGRIKDSKKYRSLYQENERLNNIINELEKESHLGMLENQNNNDYAKGLYCAYEYINQKIIKLKEGK